MDNQIFDKEDDIVDGEFSIIDNPSDNTKISKTEEVVEVIHDTESLDNKTNVNTQMSENEEDQYYASSEVLREFFGIFGAIMGATKRRGGIF